MNRHLMFIIKGDQRLEASLKIERHRGDAQGLRAASVAKAMAVKQEYGIRFKCLRFLAGINHGDTHPFHQICLLAQMRDDPFPVPLNAFFEDHCVWLEENYCAVLL